MELRITFDFWSSCFCLPRAGGHCLHLSLNACFSFDQPRASNFFFMLYEILLTYFHSPATRLLVTMLLVGTCHMCVYFTFGGYLRGRQLCSHESFSVVSLFWFVCLFGFFILFMNTNQVYRLELKLWRLMDCLVVWTNLGPYQAFFIFVSKGLLEFRTDSDPAVVMNDSKMLPMWNLKM